MIYLDNAATTPLCSVSKQALCDAADIFGNPSSLHGLGVKAQGIVDNARWVISSQLKCDAECIYFTSGATESNNTAVFGACRIYGKRKKRIVVSGVEHPSVAKCMDKLEENGFEVCRILPDNDGIITAKQLIDAVDLNTCLVSCMLVNNETGAILPVASAFSAIKRRFPDVILHCDGVQGFMKLPLAAKSLGADLISISGHKIFAPKGIGALYVKKGVRLSPLMLGGGQEKGLRSGTESVILINAFSAAVEFLAPTISERHKKAQEIKDYLVGKLSEMEGIYPHIEKTDSAIAFSPYIISVTVKRIKSETLLHFLESREIYISSGSACSKGKKSNVLSAFGYTDSELDSTIRISTTADTSEFDIDRLCKEIHNAQLSLCKIK